MVRLARAVGRASGEKKPTSGVCYLFGENPWIDYHAFSRFERARDFRCHRTRPYNLVDDFWPCHRQNGLGHHTRVLIANRVSSVGRPPHFRRFSIRWETFWVRISYHSGLGMSIADCMAWVLGDKGTFFGLFEIVKL